MKPFFKPEEFRKTFENTRFENTTVDSPAVLERLTDFCNDKLERGGMIVYGNKPSLQTWHHYENGDTCSHKALLINIESIEEALTGEDHIRLLEPLRKLEGWHDFIKELNAKGYCLDIKPIEKCLNGT